MDLDKGHLESIYENICEKRKTRDEHIEEVQRLDKLIQQDILEYRIASVNRILSFMHSNQKFIIDNPKKFDTLITHCCNKLNGNIDGIEIELRKDGEHSDN